MEETRCFIFLLFLLDFAVLFSAATRFETYNNTSPMKQNQCNPKSCIRNSDAEKPVCASDGLTYPNRCHLERARCYIQNISLVKRGPCTNLRKCSSFAQQFRKNSAIKNFIPKCRNDGSFSAIQCHPNTGYCWCVTPEGVPLPYTIVKRQSGNSKPRCGEKRKKTHRRSLNRKHKNRICKRMDKSVLNNNLINSFHTEYHMENNGRNESDTLVITWKFKMLDSNKDDTLDKIEYKDIKRVVKKVMKPKKCAKNFPKNCDVDSDEMITLQEWGECLSRDGMDEGRLQTGPSTENTDEEDETDDYEDPFRGPPHGVLSPGGMLPMGTNSYDDDSSELHEEEPADCLSDRKAAMAEGMLLYMPDCTPDGRYQKIQCYKSAGYCWCVNEDTGKNIPGTSIKNGIPKCDDLKTSIQSIRGCPDERKIVFLKELLQFLHAKMAEIVDGNTTFNSLAWIASKEEQAATWSFVVFDKNKNKMLERNEWKTFKDMVANIKGLKKCGKKLPKYCDSNKDKQISMTEWLECLNVHQVPPIHQQHLPQISGRTGKLNPLSILKAD